jgi:heme a synthase
VIADAVSQLPTQQPARFRRGPHLVAVFAAIVTLPLLYVGGSVTTYRVGLAVPDWPKTFGTNMFLYDFYNAPFGVRLEHTHRLYGAAVGLACIFLAVWFALFERRRWMKVLGFVTLATVTTQGILGGTRVTEVSTLLAAIHGAMGQACFALMVALCVFTSRKWLEGARPVPDSHHLRRRVAVLLGLVVAQLCFGSWLRHYGTWTAVVVHSTLALAIWGHALVLWIRVDRQRDVLRALVPSARALLLVSSVQMLLGAGAFLYLLPFDGIPRSVSFYQAVVRTGHQTNGALVFAALMVLTLRSFGLLRAPAGQGEPSRAAASAGIDPEPRVLQLKGAV